MISGVDLYQGNSFTAASGAGFVFLKASEGRTLRDTQFATRWASLGASGTVRGAYHFPNFANAPATDFAFFAGIVGPVLRPGDLLALDFEGDNDTHTWAQRTAWKNEFLTLAKQRFPDHRVGVYCNLSWWHGTDDNAGDFLWIADYTTAGQPRVQAPWTFHQYSTSGGIDHDVANFATVGALRGWALEAATQTPTPTEDDMPLTPQDTQAVAQAVINWSTTVPSLGGQQMSIGSAIYTAAANATHALEQATSVAAKLAALQAPATAPVDAGAVASALASDAEFVGALADAVCGRMAARLAT